MYRDSFVLFWGVIVSIQIVSSTWVAPDVSKDYTSPDQYIKGDDYKITGTHIEDYPYIVQVTKGGTLFLCFGSLITDVHVLTSAYCLKREDDFRLDFQPHEIMIKLGSPLIPLFNIGVKVKEIVIHPNYQYVEGLRSNEWPLYDAAILKMEEPVQFNQTISPIEVANPLDTSYFEGIINQNGECETFVWNNMRSTDPSDMNIDKVSAKLIQHVECKKNVLPAEKDMEVCSFVTNNDQLPCRRNLGAPLVCSGKLFGLHLKKKDCNQLPELFARIEPLYEFISQVTGLNHHTDPYNY